MFIQFAGEPVFYCDVSVYYLKKITLYSYIVSGDTRALSLRLFSEMAVLFLDQAQFDATRHKAEAQKLQTIIAETLLPQ